MSESDTLLEGYHFIRFYHILLFYCIKAFDIYYPSIARKRHRQNGCCLEVLDNKNINEEDISQEEKKI